MDNVKVVDKLTQIKGETLYVTIESDTVTGVLSNDAKKIAYAERLKHGFASAGIEQASGSVMVDAKGAALKTMRIKEGDKVKYQRTFKLTRMPI